MKPITSPFSKKKKAQALNFQISEQERTYFLEHAMNLPLVVSPKVTDLDPIYWAKQRQTWVHTHLTHYGAVLFRGFSIKDSSMFQAFAGNLCQQLFADYGDLPKAGDKTYRVTPYPPEKTIFFHNESSHLKRFPGKQFFFCEQPAATGGETPIVDCRKLFLVLDPNLAENLRTRGLTYSRHFIPGIDVSWQEFFRCDDPQKVSKYCDEQGIDYKWEGDSLITQQSAPAVIRHPVTGDLLLFNQIQLHHSAFLDTQVRVHLNALYQAERFPRQVTFGDGQQIEDQTAEDLAELYWKHAVSFPWQKGDVLMVDNLRIAHARQPFTPPRSMYVAMGDLVHQSKVDTHPVLTNIAPR